jgi:hypothetical protein
MVSYRAQRPSHLWHILALTTPIIMCIIVDLIPVLAPMPMPYYIFPNAFSEPKTRRGDVSSAPASLLHLRSRPPPCSAVLLCVPSAEAQCARAWPWVGVPVRLPVGLPLPPPALVPPTGPEPPCALTQVRPVPPLRLHAAMAPHMFRHRGPSILGAPKRRKFISSRCVSREPPSDTGRVV